MGEVVNQNWPTTVSLPPDRLLKEAMESGLTQVVILGFDKDGGWYFASSEADSGTTIYHCSKAIYKMHQIEDEMTK